ncbi:MAG: FAD-dependent catabolic D-arginine dehydrogenase DauA [Acidobacteriota bacterium]
MDADVIIVGAGFAGAATAYHLTRLSPSTRVLILEREEVPGFHASGRNASLVLQSVENPRIRRMVAQSVAAYLRHRDEVGYTPVGSLLLGSQSQLERLRDPETVESHLLDQHSVCRRVPLLEGHRFEAALSTPSDGVMDISLLLEFYLNGARQDGFKLHLRTEVRACGWTRESGWTVSWDGGELRAPLLVNAAGAWANELASAAGVGPLPMTSFKRHLFILDGPKADPDSPFVWSVDRGFYFRPESGGLLFSICDEEPAQSGFVPTVTPGISERLAELIEAELPALSEARQRQVWSCFRTKTPHGEFHLGWADDHPDFLWVAGLGGHGMGASWQVGLRAAQLLVERLRAGHSLRTSRSWT